MNEPPKEFKDKYMELQMMQQQIQQIQQQVQALDSQAGEMDLILEVLDDFSNSKPGDGYVTLTPGLFVKAKIAETDKVFLNVGAGAVVEKSIPEAKNVIAVQGGELRKLQDELSVQLKKLVERAQAVQTELRSLLK